MTRPGPIRGLLITLAAVLLLGSLWWGYRQWQYHRLSAALHDPDPIVRITAVRSADEARQSDILLEAFKDQDPDIRFVAVHLAGSHTAKSVRALLELIRDEERACVRREAVNKLRLTPPGARSAIYRALEDPDARIRAGAILALAVHPHTMEAVTERAPDEKEKIIPILQKLLEDEDSEVRQNAAVVLEELNWERGR